MTLLTFKRQHVCAFFHANTCKNGKNPNTGWEIAKKSPRKPEGKIQVCYFVKVQVVVTVPLVVV